MLGSVEADGPGRTTRSSIKPRFLFPEAVTQKRDSPMDPATTDEEALTDVEAIQANYAAPEGSNDPVTATTPVKEAFVPATPMKKRTGLGGPATPPTTVRTTRSTAKIDSSEGGSGTSLFKNDNPFETGHESSAEKISKGKKRGAPDGLAMEEAKKRMK